MPIDIVMPQMGESVAEGTIVRWMKKVGDTVERDEPLFEISTDKVNAEIPSPAAGVVAEIRARDGDTVPVNSVVAVIGQPGEAVARAVPPPAEPARSDVTTRVQVAPASIPPAVRSSPPPGPAPEAARPSAPPMPSAPPSTEDVIRQRSSPLVRKIAAEHEVDITGLRGSGIAGRVTKHDILEFIQSQTPSRNQPSPAARPAPPPPAGDGAPGDIVPMSVMRKRIAEHMVLSRRTSAHVHSVFHVNFGRVAHIRDLKKAEYERAGAKLTYLSFIIKAVVDALRATPVMNASLDGEQIIYHREINMGIAVALDWGLIVPVIKRADEKNLLGLSRAAADLAGRARSKQLKPEEVAGGTFTVTNPGLYGAQFGMPIINQPQVAILGVGTVEKRVVVIDDAIAIRPMAYLTLGYDHRLIDGAVADQFMAKVKEALEGWDAAEA